jgi:hypothetical protein
MSEVIHSRLCLTSAVRMAKENGAATLQEAIEWVRVWHGDGGLGNYGACTCELFGPERFVIRFEDWAEAQLQLEELLELAEIRGIGNACSRVRQGPAGADHRGAAGSARSGGRSRSLPGGGPASADDAAQRV